MAHTFSLLSLSPREKKQVVLLAVLAFVSLAGYVGYGVFINGEFGFPLDDSWIHQTYARNLAGRGEWAFIPGQPSAGATSPFWVLLLSIGYLFKLSPFLWSFLLGWTTLLALGFTGFILFRLLLPERKDWAIWAGLVLIFEWHMVWVAASGMETALFAAVCFVCLGVVLAPPHKTKPSRAWLVSGLLAGLSVWLRPEGLTLLVPVAITVMLSEKFLNQKLHAIAMLVIGFALLFLPYLLFNYEISESVWPNTFYAKQSEYRALQTQPILSRLVLQVWQPLIGMGLLLLPGLLHYLNRTVKQRNWRPLVCVAWVILFLLLFALRLPVVYQHGRYAMPVLPVFLLLAFTGMAVWIKPKEKRSLRRNVGIAWRQSVVVLGLAMYLIAAPAYAADVGFIQTEMVAAAYWINANTEANALIAAHDIGALGYFADRQLLDLAGLVSPDVIPFIRDENRLADYLDEYGADYLVAFPNWYPALSRRGELIFQTHGEVAPALGGENIAIFLWR